MNEVPQNATDATPQLSPAQERALQALLDGATVTEAATAAGVDRTTVHRWQRHVKFFTAMNRAKADRQNAVRAGLQSLTQEAIGTMRDLLKDPTVPPAVRLKAAMAVLGTVKGWEPERIGDTDAECFRGLV
jgi:Homeodomain-like domain-containing protein